MKPDDLFVMDYESKEYLRRPPVRRIRELAPSKEQMRQT